MSRLVVALLLLASLGVEAQPSERLHYRLSYSGLITGYIWKELADVSLNLTPQRSELNGEAAARLSMEVSTAGYTFAETFHSLRYRWESYLDPTLQRSLLVRVVDQGDSDSHDVYWYQWPQRDIAYFRKREQQDVSIPIFDSAPVLKWEENKLPPPPPFIDAHPAVGPGLSYLMMRKLKRKGLQGDAIDPVTMLQRIRHYDFRSGGELPMQILLEDDLAPYTARLIGGEALEYEGRSVATLKVEVRRSNSEGEEGALWLWLSDDGQRLPLRLDVEAPLGVLHIELQRVERGEGSATTLAYDGRGEATP